MTTGEPRSNITHLFREPKLATLLQAIEGVDVEDAKWLTIIHERCEGEELSNLFSSLDDLARHRVSPELRDRQVDEYCQAFITARERIFARVAETGRGPHEITEEDIQINEPSIKTILLDDEAFELRTRARSELIYPSETEIQRSIVEDLEIIRANVPSPVFEALLQICEITYEAGAVDFNVDLERVAQLPRLFTEIGRRVSPGYLEHVQLNPHVDPTLSEAASAAMGTTSEIELGRELGAIWSEQHDRKIKLRRTADIILETQPDQITVARINQILLDRGFINQDTHAAIHHLISADTLDYEAIVAILIASGE